MAYVSTQTRSAKTRTMIAVAALEAAAIYGIIAGLSVVISTRDPPKNPDVFFTPSPVPPPTNRPKDRHPQPSDRPQTQGPLTTPSTTPSPLPTSSPQTREGPGTASASPTPLPTTEPTPALLPVKAPVPRGRPGEWVTKSDYPSQDLREGNEGLVRFRLGVGADGKVTSCTITKSSGFSRLDAAACAKLAQRARFTPATDETGAKVAGVYYNAVRWSIED